MLQLIVLAALNTADSFEYFWDDYLSPDRQGATIRSWCSDYVAHRRASPYLRENALAETESQPLGSSFKCGKGCQRVAALHIDHVRILL